MVEVEFNYIQNKTTIQSSLNETFEEIMNKYSNKFHLDINKLNFLVYGKNINKKEALHNVINESDKQNKRIIILVDPINNIINNKNTNIKKANEIICPQCKEVCKFEIKDYHIKLYDCKNRHIIENIKLNEFMNTQNIDLSYIKCDNCLNQTKANILNNEFFTCLECDMNLCPFCKSTHDKTHSIINYDDKNYLCHEHGEKLISYCKDCNMDICFSCCEGHKYHKGETIENYLINIPNLRKKMNTLENAVKKFKKNLEQNI